MNSYEVPHHSNEFLDEESDSAAVAGVNSTDNTNKQIANSSQLSEGQSQINQHMNNLIDAYNSQMEFFKKNQKQTNTSTSFHPATATAASSELLTQPSVIATDERQIDGEGSRYQQQSQQHQQSEDGHEICPNCSRKFYSGRLALHLKSCKPNKPFKGVRKAPLPPPVGAEPDVFQQQQQPSPIIVAKSTTQSTKINTSNSIPTSNQMSSSMIKSQSKQQQQDAEETYEEQGNQGKYNIDEFEERIQQSQAQQSDDSRVECSVCHRKFMADRIAKHEGACSKAQKPRQVYNSSAARVPIDENGNKLITKPIFVAPPKEKSTTAATSTSSGAASTLKAASKSSQSETNIKAMETTTSTNISSAKAKSEQQTQQQAMKSTATSALTSTTAATTATTKPVPKWKLQHEQFIDNIRYNKKVAEVEKEGGDISQIEKPIDNSQALGFVSCPYCLRSFAKRNSFVSLKKWVDYNRLYGFVNVGIDSKIVTADRHVPLCKNIINRPKPPRQVSRQQSNKNPSASTNASEKTNAPSSATTTPATNELRKSSNRKIDSRSGEDQSNYDPYSKSSQSETNDTSDQNSLMSTKTLNSQKYPSSQRSTMTQKAYDSSTNNIKSRTGLLPDINAKEEVDKKYFTSRKFGSLTNQKNSGNKIGNTNSVQAGPLRTYEDVYTRTQQVSTVSCPYCERVFAKNAADRHIPICKHIVNRPNPFSDSARNGIRNSIPKKPQQSASQQQQQQQPVMYSQRQSLAQAGLHSQPSPRFNELGKVKIALGSSENTAGGSLTTTSTNGLIGQKPSTTDGVHAIHMKLSKKASGYCGFCGFQFAPDHKYCGCCGKKRFTQQNMNI